MYKILTMLISIFLSSIAMANSLPNEVFKKSPAVDLEIEYQQLFDEPVDPTTLGPTRAAATDAISLGLAPTWAHVGRMEDQKRMGNSGACIWNCADKNANTMDNQLKELATKYAKK